VQEPVNRHRRGRTNGVPAATVSPPEGRTVSRIYEQQGTFTRDVRQRKQQGWRLISTRRQQVGVPIELIRASAPGSLLRGSPERIVAHYTCVSGRERRNVQPLLSTMSQVSYQTRLATSAWLTRLAHAIQPPCCPE
jgi:hypothetical protein